MLRALALLGCISCISLAGCGGNVVVDHDGSGGAGGTNGPGGLGGSNPIASVGSTSTNVTTTTGTTMSTATSSSTVTTGTSSECPATPAIGGGCNIEGQSCPMANACCGAAAICKGGEWHTGGIACNEPCFPCGPELGCRSNSLCVVADLDRGREFLCVPDTCPTDVMRTCDNCGSSICMGIPPLSCSRVQGSQVSCDCPTC